MSPINWKVEILHKRSIPSFKKIAAILSSDVVSRSYQTFYVSIGELSLFSFHPSLRRDEDFQVDSARIKQRFFYRVRKEEGKKVVRVFLVTKHISVDGKNSSVRVAAYRYSGVIVFTVFLEEGKRAPNRNTDVSGMCSGNRFMPPFLIHFFRLIFASVFLFLRARNTNPMRITVKNIVQITVLSSKRRKEIVYFVEIKQHYGQTCTTECFYEYVTRTIRNSLKSHYLYYNEYHRNYRDYNNTCF